MNKFLMIRKPALLGLCALLISCSSENGLPDFIELVEETAPAIVNISGSSVQQAPSNRKWFDWFRDFEGESDGAPENSKPHISLGSGFILSRNGEILTNNHVIADAQEVMVTLSDRRQFQAKVIGRDAASDLALLKIEAKGLPALEWGNSADLKVGEWVVAIGSPFGFEHTVTAGIVSGKRRALASEQYVPFLQTDVAINPGNSGGPLFNLAGEVIGVNSQIFSRTGGYMGLSFAIPSDTARRVVEQLRQYGSVKRAWLGVVIQRVDGDLARSFGLKTAQGALISQVESDGPADRAGLKPGDVILQVDGEVVRDSSDLPPLVGQHAPGERIKFQFMRDGKRVNLQVVLDQLPSPMTQLDDWVGVELVSLNARQADRLKLDTGLLIKDIRPGLAAEKSGLKVGDIIVTAFGDEIESAEQFLQLCEGLTAGASAPLLIVRDQRSLFLALQR
ncbi:MAG: DegQ family serine endoprotease [Oceanococcus sp.]